MLCHVQIDFGTCSPGTCFSNTPQGLSLLEAILLSLVEQICLGTPQVHNLWAPVPVLLQLCALLAVVRVRYSDTSADDTAPLIRTIVALVTNAHQGARPDIRVANDALAIALLTKTADGDARLFSAHDQIWVMFCHVSVLENGSGFVFPPARCHWGADLPHNSQALLYQEAGKNTLSRFWQYSSEPQISMMKGFTHNRSCPTTSSSKRFENCLGLGSPNFEP